MQHAADESKVKALENIFGGDITASVIRTVLSTNENKFDEAVDSLLNMSTDSVTTNNTNNKSNNNNINNNSEEDEEMLLDRKEREKIKTLENMFGSDLSNSVICTVLESNKGELVDTVDTLLNMTSKEINPSYYNNNNQHPSEAQQRESERLKQEEELKAYEEFKALQIHLQEEEARAAREQKRKTEEEEALRRKQQADRARQAEMQQEQERALREFKAKKEEQERRQVEEESRRLEAHIMELERKTVEEEKLQRQQAAEESVRRAIEAENAKRRAEEELVARRKTEEELILQNEELSKRAREQEEMLRRENVQKQALQQRERKQAEELERLRREGEQLKRDVAERQRAEQRARDAEELVFQQKLEAERRVREVQDQVYSQKIEVERKAQMQRLEEERLATLHKRALEEEREQLQKERELLANMRREEEARARKVEDQRLEKERIKLEEEQRQLEEEHRRMELEREARERLQQEEEEQRRIQQECERQQEEEVRRQDEEARRAVLKEEADRQALVIEEERRKKLAYDQIAASAVFIPPKAETPAENTITITAAVSSDTVTCTWDLPEGNAAATNWLGLYPEHQPLNTKKYVQFAYTNGACTGQHTFAGVTPGHYEVRFFATRGYEHAARSPVVRVGPAASLVSQLQGDHLLVYYTIDPISPTPTREWLGIYEKTQRRNKKYLSTAYGNAEGKVMMKAPRTPGVYEVRLFATGAAYNDQVRDQFVVEDHDCINVEQSSIMAGENASISWIIRTIEPSSSDWVGLYRADEPNNSNYLSCTYTQGASVGTITVPVPKEGVYEFRLFVRAKGKYTTFRTSQPLTVVSLV